MRILPAAFYTLGWKIKDRFEFVHKLSAITHAHPRSKMACTFYTQLAVELIDEKIKGNMDVQKAYERTINAWLDYYEDNREYSYELEYFHRITSGNLGKLPEESIRSDGYVLHSLEAAIWCLLNSSSYKEAVLKAVNLGEDTDTVGALTGALAGILYCNIPDKDIPQEWIRSIARAKDILNLINKLPLKEV